MTATTSCRSCGAAIRWAATRTGRSIPLDAEPVPGGNLRLTGLMAGSRPVIEVTHDPGGDRYTSHFVTCPDATDWRRPRTR